MTKESGILIKCDYKGCKNTAMVWSNEAYPDWGIVDDKDLCPEHFKEYKKLLENFWNPVNMAEELARDIELSNEDILYDGSQVIVKEDW